MDGDWQFLRPWILGALAWLFISLVVIMESLEKQGSAYLTEIWLLLSLLWMQFGFAGLFYTLRKGNRRHLIPMTLVTLLPPLILKGIAALIQ